MIHLEFSYMTVFYEDGGKLNPFEEIEKLGIEYEYSKYIPMANSIYFFNCTFVPKELPKWIKSGDFKFLYENYK